LLNTLTDNLAGQKQLRIFLSQMAKKTIFISVSVKFQIKFFIELDAGPRDPEPLRKWTKKQSSCISPGMDWGPLRPITIL
jgi:hypothetical protein